MPSCNRLHNIAVRGCVILVALFLCPGPALTQEPPAAQPDQKKEQPQAKPQTPGPAETRPVKRVDCRAPKETADEDLCEQRRMAEAAEYLSRLTWWQVWIGAGALCGLIVTLWLTRRSVQAATKAADAANLTVAVMEKTATRELRAYIDVSPVSMSGPHINQIFRANIRATNRGQTPARDVVCVFGVCVRDFPLKEPLENIDAVKSITKPSRSVLGGNGGYSDYYPQTWGPITETELNALMSGKKAIWVFGRVTYRDVFGGEQWTEYRFMTGGDRGINGIWTAEEGNNAS